MTQKIVIVGLGETARMALHYFHEDSPFLINGFAAHKKFLQTIPPWIDTDKYRFYTIESLLEDKQTNDFMIFCAMGSSNINKDRETVYSQLRNAGYSFVNYISSSAYIAPGVEIGDNCFILEGNVIQSGVKICNNVTLWSGNHVGHCSIIENNVFISSHAVVAGQTTIGNNTFVGINATLCDNIRIGSYNYIGASSIISSSTEDYAVYRPKGTSPSPVKSTRLAKYLK